MGTWVRDSSLSCKSICFWLICIYSSHLSWWLWHWVSGLMSFWVTEHSGRLKKSTCWTSSSLGGFAILVHFLYTNLIQPRYIKSFDKHSPTLSRCRINGRASVPLLDHWSRTLNVVCHAQSFHRHFSELLIAALSKAGDVNYTGEL